jgi:hypothetical protein
MTGRRVSFALLLGGIALALLILAVPFLRPGSRGGNRAVNVDVGTVSGLRLHDAWTHVAEAAGIPPDSAEIDELILDYTSQGLLVHFLLQAWAPGGKLLSVGYQAYGLPDLADRRVHLSGSIAGGATDMPPQTRGNVDMVLSAIDGVEPSSMMAKLADVGANGYFQFSPLMTQGDGIPARAPAYIWTGA